MTLTLNIRVNLPDERGDALPHNEVHPLEVDVHHVQQALNCYHDMGIATMSWYTSMGIVHTY